MFEKLLAYLPQDRVRALADGVALPDRAEGSVLFADISGFTPLTAALTDALGPRRGVEAVSRQINAVYAALIAAVDCFDGSVIGFAGDAITCWFGGTDPALRAAACAIAQQAAMHAFSAVSLPNGATTPLAVKVVVASGSVRRFTVGDPAIQCLDTLAGTTVARLGDGEQLARRGEVLVDEATAALLGSGARLGAWRSNQGRQARFAVLQAAPSAPQSTYAAMLAVPLEQLRKWVLPAIADKELSGQSDFVTEFRPAVSLFARFSGIDYDQDDAGAKLDAFIVYAQRVINDYGGVLLQLTIADKGSYIHAVFGAPVAHEDDPRRAVKAALDLQELPLQLPGLDPLQIGLTRSILSAGVLGASTRRTYNTWGDEVNLAARLMGIAAPGEILLSGRAQQAIAADFTFEPRPPLAVKGKTEPLPIFAVTGARRQRAIRLQEPTYALPMVGRQAELHAIRTKLELTAQGQGQVVGIAAEAGVGKSRLIAEVIRTARRLGFTGYGGACQSDAIHTPYLAWKTIWSAFFNIDPELTLRKQMRLLEGEIEDHTPQRIDALPLLSAVLDLSIPHNEFTRALEPKYRKGALHALLEDCLKTAAHEAPILLVVEDVQWIDALSFELLEEIVRSTDTLPVCIVLAYRPRAVAQRVAEGFEQMPHFTQIDLSELSLAESEQAIRAKLAQLYPARRGGLTAALIEKLMERAQGNPFYLEELLNYFRDRGLDPLDAGDLAAIELPESLHALVLSRIDQLSDPEKLAIRVSSIIGRLFRVAWLIGYFPALGELPEVKAGLDRLDALDITPLNTPEPELSYLFKHIVTHEVTYESLPYATRALLHEQLAQYLEELFAAAPPLDLLAYHYGQSTNIAKQREFLRKAGDAAAAAFANASAVAYFARLLPLLADSAAQVELLLRQGGVLERMGHWDEAEATFRSALTHAEGNITLTARVQYRVGALLSLRSDYAAALDWLEQARSGCAALADEAGLAQLLVEMGNIYRQKGEHGAARQTLEQGLALARKVRDRRGEALALENLGKVARDQGEYGPARALHEESLALARANDDLPAKMRELDNLGTVATELSEYALAKSLHEESLALARMMGDKFSIAVALESLGHLANYQGELPAAQKLFEESLVLRRELGHKRGIAGLLFQLANVISNQGNNAAALPIFQESLAMATEVENRDIVVLSLIGLGSVAAEQGDYPSAQHYLEKALALAREMGDRWNIAVSLLELGNTMYEQGDFVGARPLYAESLQGWHAIGVTAGVVETLVRIAVLSLRNGDAMRATRLAAAAEAVRVSVGYTLLPTGKRAYDQVLASVQSALGVDAFSGAWAEGQNMTAAAAVALGLSLSSAPAR